MSLTQIELIFVCRLRRQVNLVRSLDCNWDWYLIEKELNRSEKNSFKHDRLTSLTNAIRFEIETDSTNAQSCVNSLQVKIEQKTLQITSKSTFDTHWTTELRATYWIGPELIKWLY